MKKIPLVCCLGVFLILAGCQTGVRTESIADIFPRVMDRHDAYTATMENEAERRTATHDSGIVRGLFDTNRGGTLPDTFPTFLAPVLTRHDGWVKVDETLAPVARDVYLDSSTVLRLLFQIPTPPMDRN